MDRLGHLVQVLFSLLEYLNKLVIYLAPFCLLSKHLLVNLGLNQLLDLPLESIKVILLVYLQVHSSFDLLDHRLLQPIDLLIQLVLGQADLLLQPCLLFEYLFFKFLFDALSH